MRGPGKPNVVVLTLVALPIATLPLLAAGGSALLTGDTRLYVAKPNHGAIVQIADLTSAGSKADADLIKTMIETPQAVWLTGGSPKQVLQDVRNTVERAADKGTVPLLVAYNLPYRDCAQYSAGGATSAQAYQAWIDGFAAGIGSRTAVVILEPDGLGIIPWYKQFRGFPSEAPSPEWCQPGPPVDPATVADERFALLRYAVDALKARPNTAVYLDGTHSNWLGAGDAAHRLAQAGVDRADGFFLNVSNYQATERLQKYGTWISKCLWFALHGADWSRGHFDWCASQYYPASPGDFSTWTLTDQWYTDNVESQTYAGYTGTDLQGFVVDTSRNGQGPWTPAVSYPDPQDWCNPPARGLGARPTTTTGIPLVDAFLWIKIPGESDGQCNRGAGGAIDPARDGMTDPAAGLWFPDMAIALAHNANPPLQ